MKNIICITFTVLFLGACNGKELTLLVENQSPSDRVSEIVTVDWNTIVEELNLSVDETIVILDNAGNQVAYQLLNEEEDKPQSLIFPADVKANSSAKYIVKKGTPQKFDSLTYGRHVPERLDDFAWENNRIAFRMYGPALSGTISNGVDVWVKRTDSLIVNKFYNDDLKNRKSYHIDHGEGLDCYDVSWTLGAGGIAPYMNSELWIGKPYSSFQVLNNGPLRTTFILNYDSLYVDGKYLQQKLTVSIDANSQFNKAIVVYSGESEILTLAAGIALHGGEGKLETNVETGSVTYAEDHKESGWIYVAVVLPEGISEITQDEKHVLALATNKTGQPFTYYFGAGWSKWGFETNTDWTNYVNEYIQKIKQPLKTIINH